MSNGLAFLSYILASAAGVCFISGLAVLNGGKRRK